MELSYINPMFNYHVIPEPKLITLVNVLAKNMWIWRKPAG